MVATPSVGSTSAFSPLRERTFRTIWLASLLSNFGQLILGVGAAWEMTRLAHSASMVALVQAAMMLPGVLVSVPAGAIADMFDRRKIAMTGLSIAALSATALALTSAAHMTTPGLLLMFCSLICAGVALYSPAWQSSISEQVGPAHLASAVALGSVSYNLARSFGPAIGGLIVLAVGATGAFAVNAAFYLPLLVAFFFWRRAVAPSRLPPERFDRAIIAGARYAIHAPVVRTVMVRTCVYAMASAAVTALAPLVARDLLGGDAITYGIILGAMGVGAVAGAFLGSKLRQQFGSETVLRFCAGLGGLAIVTIGLSHSSILTAACAALVGVANMVNINTLNVSIQMSVPRWVMARSLSWFAASIATGVGVGAAIWGFAAAHWGVSGGLIGSGVALTASGLLGLVLPAPNYTKRDVQMVEHGGDPEVVLAITNRSGPIVIELDYQVDPDQARQFYNAMMDLQRVRQRNGAFDWSLARDLANSSAWTERYHFPTWADYLRHRSRFTEDDRAVLAAVTVFDRTAGSRTTRRRLERPFGSVRWRSETPDPQQDPLSLLPP